MRYLFILKDKEGECIQKCSEAKDNKNLNNFLKSS